MYDRWYGGVEKGGWGGGGGGGVFVVFSCECVSILVLGSRRLDINTARRLAWVLWVVGQDETETEAPSWRPAREYV